MKAKLDPRLKLARVRHPLTLDPGDDRNGAFMMRVPTGRRLYILASSGMGWDHVSVSVVDSNETPTWEEMCFVKDFFFEPEEMVIQYHPARSQYVNFHEGCLHLWRPQHEAVPVPPIIMV